MSSLKIKELEAISREVRVDVLKMTERAGSGHPGGSLSCVDILVVLYFHKMMHNPNDPKWSKRDIFVLSKGHAAPALYAVLAEAGYFSIEELKTLRKFGSRLQGHPVSTDLPGVEFSAGLLGQGLSFINGMASRAKLKGNSRRHYVLLSDGEMQYGQIWQAAMTASQLKLDNVFAIVDCNGWQIDGRIKEIKNIEPLKAKWESFGWLTYEVDGHNLSEIIDFLNIAETITGVTHLPACLIARTVKGRGVSFMENNNEFHGRAPTREELEKALLELGGELWENRD